MEWAKTRSNAKFNLATSGVLECSLDELGVQVSDFELRRSPGYPYEPLQQALADKCHVSSDCIVTAMGTSFANHLALAFLLSPGDEILIEHPAYDPLVSVARYLGATIKRFHRRLENGFRLDPAEIRQLAGAHTRLIVLTNLHNPSSAVTTDDVLSELQTIAQQTGAHILVDEVYLELLAVAGVEIQTAFRLGPEFIVTSSLTKAYGLSGLRCGWILAEPALASRLWRFHDLFYATPPHLTERFSVVALRHLDRIRERAKRLLTKNRALLNEFLDSRHDLDVVRSEVGTVIFPRSTRVDSESLCAILRSRYETSVVPGSFFEMPNHFRLGIGGATEVLAQGLERMTDALNESF
jgi:aspartate/methionine/tyrosine aminotransferase